MDILGFHEVMDRYDQEVASGRRCPCVDKPVPRGDSELERMFWHMAEKPRAVYHGCSDQFRIGRYRVDALYDCGDKLVVIELDGKAFHDAERDQIRDAEIIKSVDAIVRIPFPAMYHYQRATFRVLEQWFPRFDLGDWWPLFHSSEFLDDYEQRKESDDYSNDTDEWLDEVDGSYEIWAITGANGRVGSPKGFLGITRNIYDITIQRGKGHDPRLMEGLYEQSRCIRGAELSEWEIRTGRAKQNG